MQLRIVFEKLEGRHPITATITLTDVADVKLLGLGPSDFSGNGLWFTPENVGARDESWSTTVEFLTRSVFTTCKGQADYVDRIYTRLHAIAQKAREKPGFNREYVKENV